MDISRNIRIRQNRDQIIAPEAAVSSKSFCSSVPDWTTHMLREKEGVVLVMTSTTNVDKIDPNDTFISGRLEIPVRLKAAKQLSLMTNKSPLADSINILHISNKTKQKLPTNLQLNKSDNCDVLSDRNVSKILAIANTENLSNISVQLNRTSADNSEDKKIDQSFYESDKIKTTTQKQMNNCHNSETFELTPGN